MSGDVRNFIADAVPVVAQFVPGVNSLAWGYRLAVHYGARVVGGYIRDRSNGPKNSSTMVNVRSNEAAMPVVYGRRFA